MNNQQKNFFGFTFQQTDKMIPSPVTPDRLETSVDITGYGNFFSPDVNQVDVQQGIQSENELIKKYRDVSYLPEVDKAIEEITAEAIVTDRFQKIVQLNLDQVQMSDSIKNRMQNEFTEIYKLLSFHNKGHDIFRRWYIDGKIFYFIIIDPKNPSAGIQELRYVDPRKIKKIREIVRKLNPEFNTTFVSGVKEYFLFSERGISSIESATDSIRLTKESVATAGSGLLDPTTNVTVSYLHKALRSAANLRMMEDAMLIYRLARAPERRIFYVDTGNLPKGKSESYVQDIANKYRTKSVYDPQTGEIKNDTRYLAMTEDFWIPRREGSKGTEISTLPGGQQVGETGESDYFKHKLYEALNIPMSRFEQEQALFSQGTEITRDELRFARFIDRLRIKFSTLFEELLCRQLVLKGIMSEDDWESVKHDIIFAYAEDNQFSESLDIQVMQGRVDLVQAVDAFQGKYFSKEYIMRNVLRFTQDQITDMDDQMNKEQVEELQHNAALGLNPDGTLEDAAPGQSPGQAFLSSGGLPPPGAKQTPNSNAAAPGSK